MKLTTLLLLISLFRIQANTYSQNTRITIEEKSATIMTVLEKIESLSEFKFLGNENVIRDFKLVTVKVKRRPVNEILDILFKGTNVTYKIFDRQIILKKEVKDSDSKNNIISKLVLKEKKTQAIITGIVTDEDGTPLAGASIIEKGTTNGTQTDFDGNFSLELITENTTLVASYIGFSSVEIIVKNDSRINIILKESAAGLDEVIVVGYGTQKKSAITGSVVKVDSEDLVKVSVANTTELLSGRVSGLITKQTSGVPGEDGTQLNIRGFGNPLILVDGIEMALGNIDPNDIESVNVLKDASAAIYGARAGNGVVLVTTKRGKVGKPKIQYSGVTSFQQPTVWRNNVDGGQYVELLNEGGGASFTQEEITSYKAQEPGFETYDWERAVFRTWAPLNQHNISVRGGSEKVKFFSSIGSLKQGGQFRSGDLNYNRINVRSNVDATITDNLTFGIDASYRTEERSEPGRDLRTIYTALTSSEPIIRPFIPGFPDLAPTNNSSFNNRSPVGSSRRDISGFVDTNTETLNGRMTLNYKVPFIKGLSAKASVSYTSEVRRTTNFNIGFRVYEFDEQIQEPIAIGGNESNINNLSEETRQFKTIIPSFALSYDRDFGDHAIKGLLLTEAIDEEIDIVGATRRNLLSTSLPYLDFGDLDGLGNYGRASEFGRSSFVGRANYAYNNKYFLEGSFRYDASSDFSEDTRWGFFPSVSAAWRISEENFIKDKIDFIDNLKLRVSYSETGNDVILDGNGDRQFFRYLSANEIQTGESASYLFNPSGLATAIATTGLANPNVTWRDLTTYNVGLDASFWGGKLGIELDVFYRLQEGIFATPLDQFPSTFGAELPQVNQNSTDNRGFDLTLSHRNNIGDFKYNVGVSFGLAREKFKHWPVDRDIEAFAENEEELNDPEFRRRFNLIQLNSGNWRNRNIGYRTDGIFMSQEEIDNHTVDQSLLAGGIGNESLRPGDIRYIDLNGDNFIDWRDQDEIGKGGLPDIAYGLNLDMSYKGFSISALFQGATGFNFNINGSARTIFINNTTPFKYQYDYRWAPDPNDPTVNINPNAILPGATDASAVPNNNVDSDFWLQDGTYIRLKNLNIGYDIPKNAIEKFGFDSIRLFISGSNLVTWNKLGIYKGSFDSEGPASQTGNSYPLLKTISMGINLSL